MLPGNSWGAKSQCVRTTTLDGWSTFRVCSPFCVTAFGADRLSLLKHIPVASLPRILTRFPIKVRTFKHGRQILSALIASSSVFRLASLMCSPRSNPANLLHSLNNVVSHAPLLWRMLVPDWMLLLLPGLTAQCLSLSSFVQHTVVEVSPGLRVERAPPCGSVAVRVPYSVCIANTVPSICRPGAGRGSPWWHHRTFLLPGSFCSGGGCPFTSHCLVTV